MSWDYLDAISELYKLWNRLTSGFHFPSPLRQVAIPKQDGGERHLRHSTLLDGIAQQVVKKHLEQKMDPLFLLILIVYGAKRVHMIQFDNQTQEH